MFQMADPLRLIHPTSLFFIIFFRQRPDLPPLAQPKTPAEYECQNHSAKQHEHTDVIELDKPRCAVGIQALTRHYFFECEPEYSRQRDETRYP